MAGLKFRPSKLEVVLGNSRLHSWYKEQLKPRLAVGGYPDTCPFHDSKSGTSFKGTGDGWYCHACEIGGGHLEFAFYEDHGPEATPTADAYEELMLRLAEEHGVPLPQELLPTEAERMARAHRKAVHDLLTAAVNNFQLNLHSPAGKAERAYLLGPERGFGNEQLIRDGNIGLHLGPVDLAQALRGHDLDLARELGLLSDNWGGYITIPLYDAGMKLTGLAGRKTPERDDGPKWRYTSGFDKHEPLYLGFALTENHRELTVVEGVFDGLHHQVNGVHDTVAAGGKELTDRQIEALVRHCIKRVTLCPDPDTAGLEGTRKSIERLARAGVPTYVMEDLPPKIDPDLFLVEQGIDAWRRRRDEADSSLLWGAKDCFRGLPEKGSLPPKARDAALERYRDLLLALATKTDWASVENSVMSLLRERTGLSLTQLRAILNVKKIADSRDPPQTPAANGSPTSGGRFYACDGGLWIETKDREGNPVHTRLTNFVTTIVGELDHDDGYVRTKFLKLSSKLLDGRTITCEVEAGEFASLSWVASHLGAAAIVSCGKDRRDQARQAIQELSFGKTAHETRIGHTGWRYFQEEDAWGYCHAGGVIGAEVDVKVQVGCEQRVAQYCLPDPPEGEDLVQGLQLMFRLLYLLGVRLFTVLFGCAFHAPLGEWDDNDWVTFLAGSTGSKKSSLASFAQACFGAKFTHNHLPGSFESTANALGKQAAELKDAIYVVDDLVPRGGKFSDHRQKCERLVRGVGNQAGRARLNADTSGKATHYPRCSMVMTGEDMPLGQSDRARLVLVRLDRDVVPLGSLLAFEPHRRVLSRVMAGFIRWLAERIDWVKDEAPALRLRYAAEFAQAGGHDRLPTNFAGVMVGFHMLMEFAKEVGAYDATQAEDRRVAAQKALKELMLEQSAAVKDENPGVRFIELLMAALRAGKAYVLGRIGREPDGKVAASLGGSDCLGWAPEVCLENDFKTKPRGEFVGYVGDEPRTLLLDPENAHAAVQRYAKAIDRPFEMSSLSIWRDLHEANMLVATDIDKSHRNTYGVRRTIGKKSGTFIYVRVPEPETEKAPETPTTATEDVPIAEGPSPALKPPAASQKPPATSRKATPASRANRNP